MSANKTKIERDLGRAKCVFVSLVTAKLSAAQATTAVGESRVNRGCCFVVGNLFDGS